MPDGWIAGATRIDGTKDGDTYRTNVPWRHVWHTMEAPADNPPGTGPWGSVPGLIAYIKAHQWPPHIWCWPERDWVGQTINLYRSAYALVHSWSGYPETNHARAIQVEILGYARDAPCIEHAAWLGRRVLKPVIDEGIPINLLRWAPSTGPDGAGTNGTVRLPADVWYEFDGQCGHANVPRNEHWDPGRADYPGIAKAAKPPVTPEEDDLAYYTIYTGPGMATRLSVDGSIVTAPADELAEMVAAYKKAGYKEHRVAFGEADDYARFVHGHPTQAIDNAT